MHEAPGPQLPPEGTTLYDALVAQDALEFRLQEQTKQTEAAMSDMVANAANIGPDTYRDFTINGKRVHLELSEVSTRDPNRPANWQNHDEVRVRLRDTTTFPTHVLHDLALGQQESGEYSVQYWEHHYDKNPYGRNGTVERLPNNSPRGYLTPRDVASGQLPEFTEVADALREISAQVTRERASAGTTNKALPAESGATQPHAQESGKRHPMISRLGHMALRFLRQL